MIDVNKPVTNPKLVELLVKMRDNEKVDNQNEVLEEVAMNAIFLTPTNFSTFHKSENEKGEIVLKEDTTIQFEMITNSENQTFFLAFTDWYELRKWKNDNNQQTLILLFDDYANMIINNETVEGFVINPFGANLMLNRQLIQHLKMKKEIITMGHSEQIVKEETKVMLGEPANYPSQMIEAIKEYMKSNKGIKAAYLRLMVKDNEQSYLLIVDFDGDKNTVFGAISSVARPYLKDIYLDMIPLKSDFGTNATIEVKPFYKKKKFGLF